jgi:hypothetical protein
MEMKIENKSQNESLLHTTNVSEFRPNDRLKELELEIQLLKNDNRNISSERDNYMVMYTKYYKMATDMAEEVIILRNQLDKFLNYKK